MWIACSRRRRHDLNDPPMPPRHPNTSAAVVALELLRDRKASRRIRGIPRGMRRVSFRRIGFAVLLGGLGAIIQCESPGAPSHAQAIFQVRALPGLADRARGRNLSHSFLRDPDLIVARWSVLEIGRSYTAGWREATAASMHPGVLRNYSVRHETGASSTTAAARAEADSRQCGMLPHAETLVFVDRMADHCPVAD
jgi:hypothetical protein